MGILADLPSSASPALRASLRERLVAIRGGGAVPPELLSIRVERMMLAEGAEPVHIVRPDDWSALREAERKAGRDTPYWAIPWPSGQVLAKAVTREPPAPGARVLELGCGLAVPSIAAARAGASVLATDGSADSAVFAAHNLELNELEGEVLAADWREAIDDLAAERWDLVLAADVLYLRDHVESLLRLLPRLMGPQTVVWLADPGRSGAEEFLQAAKKLWDVRSERDADDDRVTIHRLRSR